MNAKDVLGLISMVHGSSHQCIISSSSSSSSIFILSSSWLLIGDCEWDERIKWNRKSVSILHVLLLAIYMGVGTCMLWVKVAFECVAYRHFEFPEKATQFLVVISRLLSFDAFSFLSSSS